MKKLLIISIVLFLIVNHNAAQDTLYVYKAGQVVTKKALNDLDSLSFTYTPPATGTVNDIDGNTYDWIKIGTQTWMTENLKTTKFRTGESISNIKDGASWWVTTFAAWVDYNNNATNGVMYGKLYNWYAVNDSRNIAPIGWHVPTDAEWTTLTTFLGGEGIAGSKLKEAGVIHWAAPNTGATNETGFTALPGGYYSSAPTFYGIGNSSFWWCMPVANSTWTRYAGNDYSDLKRSSLPMICGCSVRCIKD